MSSPLTSASPRPRLPLPRCPAAPLFVPSFEILHGDPGRDSPNDDVGGQHRDTADRAGPSGRLELGGRRTPPSAPSPRGRCGWPAGLHAPAARRRQSGQSSPQGSPRTPPSTLGAGNLRQPACATARPNSSVRRGAAEVAGADAVPHDRSGDGVADALGAVQLADVVEHHGGREHLGRRVGHALPRDVGRAAVHRLEDGRLGADVGAGARPSPPTRPETSSLRMSPNMLVVTITSNCSGRMTSCMAVLSTIMSLDSTRPSYSLAMARPTSRKSPLTILRMLALCTMVTFRRPCLSAYSKA